MSPDRPEPELDAEQEVDLRSVWQRIVERWYLPVGGLVVGAIVGVLVAAGGSDTYRADTLMYLGQPFAPGGSGQIQTLATNPKTVSEIIRSEAALREAARASGLAVRQLRGNVTSKAIAQAGSPRGVSPLVEITVYAPQAAKADRAADALAERVREQTSGYTATKRSVVQRQVDTAIAELVSIQRQLEQTNTDREAALAAPGLSSTDRLLLSTSFNQVLGRLEDRRSSARENRAAGEQLLALIDDVEMPRVLEAAAAKRDSAGGSRTGVVGGLIGLVLGAAAAVVADPFLRRRAAGTA
jgi:hypothetical protein